MHHRTLGDKIFDFFNVIFFVLFAVVTLYPFWSTLMTSFMDVTGYYHSFLNLWPVGFTISAYKHIFSTNWIPSGFMNSVIYTFAGSAVSMFLVCCTAFAMTKPGLIGKRFINTYFLVTMYFGGGIVPYYIIVSQYLHLGGTRWVMILPFGLNVWAYLVLRNFIKELSQSLIDSARIDGAGEFTILGRIILPLSLPSISTLTMFAMIGKWNDWFQAKIFLSVEEYLYPLQMILRRVIIEPGGLTGSSAAMNEMEKARQVQGTQIFEPAMKAALIMTATIPIVCVYPFIQKYFDKGVMIGSLKE